MTIFDSIKYPINDYNGMILPRDFYKLPEELQVEWLTVMRAAKPDNSTTNVQKLRKMIMEWNNDDI